MLPVLYEFPDDINADPEKWGDSANWWMVNPNLGRPVTIERLQADHQAAKDTSEEEFRRWASQHLNIEIGLALRSDRWVGADYWEACGDKSVTLDALLERSDVIVCGIDGGGLDDLRLCCHRSREGHAKMVTFRTGLGILGRVGQAQVDCASTTGF